MEMDMDSIFREYGMDGIEAQLGELFPTLQIDLETLLKQAFTGDIKGALAAFGADGRVVFAAIEVAD